MILNRKGVIIIKYNTDDLYFDLETRGNFFVTSHYYPEQDKAVISFLESLEPKYIKKEITNDSNHAKTKNKFLNELVETNTLYANKKSSQTVIDKSPETIQGFLQEWYDRGPDDWNVTSKQEVLDKITNHIKKIVPAFKDTTIEYENLSIPEDFEKFAKRYGITFAFPIPKEKDRNSESHKRRRGIKDFSVIYQTDNKYDPNKHGLRIGYNSSNYDEVMLAHYIGKLMGIPLLDKITDNKNGTNNYRSKFYKEVIYKKDINDNGSSAVNPKTLVDFNNYMFSQTNMKYALSNDEHNHDKTTYRAWEQSNRFVDITALNPTRISLKRAAMALGYKIEESDTNRDPTAELNSLEDIMDLIAYNMNDVYATKIVFESKSYQNRYEQNQQLLKEFPTLIYQQDPNGKSKFDYIKSQDHIRWDRLTINNTGTKIVENIIAPYDNTKIKDNETLNLDFPGKLTAERLQKEGKLPKFFKGEPKNVLDYVEYLLKKIFKNAKVPIETQEEVMREFKKINDYYRPMIGKNYNNEIETVEYTQPSKNKILIRYITPNKYYHDPDTKKYQLASYVTLALGGVHGSELLQSVYDNDNKAYLLHQKTLTRLKAWLSKETGTNIKTDDELTTAIQNLRPNDTFASIKRTPLPFDENLTIGDMITSNSNRKKVKLKTVKKASWTDSQGKIKEKYLYTSSGIVNHEDFDSYYPSLISLLNMFVNEEGDDIYTDKLYLPRVKLKKLVKKLSKDPNADPDQLILYSLRQMSMKLMINSASGAADLKYSSKIKCNNKAMAMRIIGQIFCWFIGQTLSLFNARIPSSNTDGLYSMNIKPEFNDRIVESCAKEILLGIDPEVIPIFHSKDANNRLESEANDKTQLASAKGGSLTSWNGPSTSNSLDHPAIIDRILAMYMLKKENPINSEFDRPFAEKEFTLFIQNTEPSEIMRFLQFPFVSSPNKGRIIFKAIYNNNETKPTGHELLSNVNRGYLVKDTASDYTLKMTKLNVVQKATVNKRLKDLNISDPSFGDFINIDPLADIILKESMLEKDYNSLINTPYDSKTNKKGTPSNEKPRDITIGKISNLNEDQRIYIFNDDLQTLTKNEVYNFIKEKLDTKAYIDLVQTKFEEQWQNTSLLTH